METKQNNLNSGKSTQPKGNIISDSHGAILVGSRELPLLNRRNMLRALNKGHIGNLPANK